MLSSACYWLGAAAWIIAAIAALVCGIYVVSEAWHETRRK